MHWYLKQIDDNYFLICSKIEVTLHPSRDCNKKRRRKCRKINSYTLLMRDILDEMKKLHLSMSGTTQILTWVKRYDQTLLMLTMLRGRSDKKVISRSALWSTKQIVYPQFKASKLVGLWQKNCTERTQKDKKFEIRLLFFGLWSFFAKKYGFSFSQLILWIVFEVLNYPTQNKRQKSDRYFQKITFIKLCNNTLTFCCLSKVEQNFRWTKKLSLRIFFRNLKNFLLKGRIKRGRSLWEQKGYWNRLGCNSLVCTS